VARVIRTWLARRGRIARACRAAASALEGSAASLAKTRDRVAVRELLGQVTALLENAGASVADADENLARMLMRLRFLALDHLIELGDSMPRAIAIGEPLTADLRRTLGASHPDTLKARNFLATAYEGAGRVVEAIQLIEQTLTEQERLLGPDDPETMRSRNDLARAYREAGRVADAVPLVEQTLAARERILGTDHPSTLASRNNLASAYRATGRPGEAIPLFERNVAACERLFGADHPKTLASRHSLDLACQESAQAGNDDP
jgi:tetratricopeptide (TPR) repeat protein